MTVCGGIVSGLVETLRQDYIRTARAKGLSEWRVVTVRALRGAILPVVSFSGPALAFLITGTVGAWPTAAVIFPILCW